ncbi:MAG: rhodanese-like domain-containing protein, partial [Rhodopila sp.]
DDLKRAGLTPDHTLYFICRSGARSMAAAAAAQKAGFPRVFNVADGFEGPPDVQGHRGRTAGWKADGLPWRQQ